MRNPKPSKQIDNIFPIFRRDEENLDFSRGCG
jgi:hypothetical protein